MQKAKGKKLKVKGPEGSVRRASPPLPSPLPMYNVYMYMCAGLMSGWGCRDGSPGGGDESIHSANHTPAYMCTWPM